MAYEPTEWKAGDVITGSKMNKIEAQLAANTEEIESVIPQENLFALTKSVEGYINTDGGVAAPGAEAKERVSEYIAVTPGDAMAYQCWVNVPAGSIPWAAYCFYNSDRAKTGSVVAVTDATSTASDGSKYIAQTFTVPSGAAYIRVSFRTFGAARAKLEVGSTPTLYVVNKHDYLALQQINALGAEAGGLKSALGKDEITSLLLADPIPDTVQAITFDANGNVQTITHSRDGAAVRTDAFVFADGSITETRTLATGESLTIVTNTDTLLTTSTYAEETA